MRRHGGTAAGEVGVAEGAQEVAQLVAPPQGPWAREHLSEGFLDEVFGLVMGTTHPPRGAVETRCMRNEVAWVENSSGSLGVGVRVGFFARCVLAHGRCEVRRSRA